MPSIASFISEMRTWRTVLLSVAFMGNRMIARMWSSAGFRADRKTGSTRDRRHSNSGSTMAELLVEAGLETRPTLAGMANVLTGVYSTGESFVAQLKAEVFVLNAADFLTLVHSTRLLLAAAFGAEVFAGASHDLQILITGDNPFGRSTSANYRSIQVAWRARSFVTLLPTTMVLSRRSTFQPFIANCFTGRHFICTFLSNHSERLKSVPSTRTCSNSADSRLTVPALFIVALLGAMVNLTVEHSIAFSAARVLFEGCGITDDFFGVLSTEAVLLEDH